MRCTARSAISWGSLAVLLLTGLRAASAQTTLQPQTMRAIGQVDPRFVSYNIEAVEVTGGRFWKPYSADLESRLAESAQKKTAQNAPVGMDPSLFQYRPPIDLKNPRLRKLAAALGPAYVRVSGTWMNGTHFQNDDQPAQQTPPKGFRGVMTRAQWKGVVDFSHAAGADIVTSVAISDGTRDQNGAWTPNEAKALFDYTKQIGGRIAATEFMNEPTFAVIGGAPQGYDAAAFARDTKAFRAFLRSESPETVFLGPGSVGEGIPLAPGGGGSKLQTLNTEDILKATGPIFDAFSYHFYGTVSRRCTATLEPKAGMRAEDALTPAWFERNLTVEAFYAKLRDTYLPGKDLWLTETGEAACGGDPWAADFIDSFRYLDQLGTLAQKGVKTVMQNTLASSDYGLLDEETLEPRPNYWAALLWKRTMGSRVLDPGIRPTATLRVFAQCMKNSKGGVSVLAMNLDRRSAQSLEVPLAAERYTLSAPELLSRTVSLNGEVLKAAEDGTPPAIQGQPMEAGRLALPPLTITFVTMPGAKNPSCQ